MEITKETIYECIALLNTANYYTETLYQKRDEVVNSLKKQLSIHTVMQATPEKVCDKCLGKGGHHIYDSYIECKVCNGSGTTNL